MWVLLFVAFQAAWILAIIIHELGHAGAAYALYGPCVADVSFWPLGGRTIVVESGNETPTRELLQYLAGPIAPIIVGALLMKRRVRPGRPFLLALNLSILPMGLGQLANSLLAAASGSGDLAAPSAQIIDPQAPAMIVVAWLAAALLCVVAGGLLVYFLPPRMLRAGHDVATVVPPALVGGPPLAALLGTTYLLSKACRAASPFGSASPAHARFLVIVAMVTVVAAGMLLVALFLKSRAVALHAGLYACVVLLPSWTQIHPLRPPVPAPLAGPGELARRAQRDPYFALIQAAEEDYASGRYADAAQKWGRIRELSPVQSINVFLHGRALLMAGRTDEAVRALDRAAAMRDDPGNAAILPDIHHWLGRTYLKRGDLVRACHYFLMQRTSGRLGDSEYSQDPEPFIRQIPSCVRSETGDERPQ